MSNIVQLRAPVAELEPATFSAAWALLPETMRRRSDSRAKCEVLWDREAKRLGGQLVLLAKLKTYLRDDKDVGRSGGPGLQVLMRSGRLEHWVETVSDSRPVEPFPMLDLRAEVAAQKGEAFCRSYLDRCTAELAQSRGNVLIVPTHFAMDKLKEVAAIMKAHGFTGMRKR